MTDPRFGCVRQRAHPERDEGLEERFGHVRAGRSHERVRGQTHEPSGQGRVGQLMLRSLLEATPRIVGWEPTRDRVKQPQLGEPVPGDDRRRLVRLTAVAAGRGVQQQRVCRSALARKIP